MNHLTRRGRFEIVAGVTLVLEISNQAVGVASKLLLLSHASNSQPPDLKIPEPSK